MADVDVVVGDLVVEVLDVGSGRTREQEVVVEFTSLKTTDPIPVRESWKITVSGGIVEAIQSLMQQYNYSLVENQDFKDLFAENPFKVRLQRTP